MVKKVYHKKTHSQQLSRRKISRKRKSKKKSSRKKSFRKIRLRKKKSKTRVKLKGGQHPKVTECYRKCSRESKNTPILPDDPRSSIVIKEDRANLYSQCAAECKTLENDLNREAFDKNKQTQPQYSYVLEKKLLKVNKNGEALRRRARAASIEAKKSTRGWSIW